MIGNAILARRAAGTCVVLGALVAGLTLTPALPGRAAPERQDREVPELPDAEKTAEDAKKLARESKELLRRVSEANAANQALAREQIKLVDQALDDLYRLYRGGEVSISDPRFTLWSRRKLEALRTARTPKAEMVAALEGYVKQTRDAERFARQTFERGQATRFDLTEAQYRRLEAEIWLNQEKAK